MSMASMRPARYLLRLLSACTALVWVLVLAPDARAELVVVTAPTAKVAALSREQVADVFLGRATFLPGFGSVLPLDQPESNPLRDEFYTKVIGKSAAQAKSYWAKLAFTGKGRPPREMSNTAEIKRIVSGTPGALAYIERSAVDGSVKVLFASP